MSGNGSQCPRGYFHRNAILQTRLDQPNRSLGPNKGPMSGVDRHLVTVQGLGMVTGEPDPGSFEVGLQLSGKVDGQECCKTVMVSGCGFRDAGPVEALNRWYLPDGRSYSASLCRPWCWNARSIGRRWLQWLQIQGTDSWFSECKEETLAWATDGEDCSTNLGGPLRTNSTNLDDNPWVVDTIELGLSTGNNSPFFTKGVDSSWDLQGIGCKASSRIEGDDPGTVGIL